MNSRNATPASCTTRVNDGHSLSTSCSPKPINTSNSTNPSVAPATCRWLARKPNCAPELNATMFTGPGVMDAARANAAIDTIRLIAHLLQIKEQGTHGSQQTPDGIEGNYP